MTRCQSLAPRDRRPAQANTGTDNKDVDRTVRLGHGRYAVLDLDGLAHVYLPSAGGATLFLDTGRDFLGATQVDIGDGHPRAALSKPGGNGGA